MEIFVRDFFNLLIYPPGNLVYHLVLVFSITTALQITLSRFNTQRSLITRLSVGLGMLLLGQIILFLSSGFAWQGIIGSRILLPPIDRAVNTYSITWIIWLWCFQKKSRIPDVGIGLFNLAIVIFLVFSLTAWNTQSASMPFNDSWIDWVWGIFSVLLVMGGMLILLLQHPEGWGIAVGMLSLILAGYVAHFAFITPEGDLSPIIRLAYLCAFPLLPTLTQRIRDHYPQEGIKQQVYLTLPIEKQDEIETASDNLEQIKIQNEQLNDNLNQITQEFENKSAAHDHLLAENKELTAKIDELQQDLLTLGQQIEFSQEDIKSKYNTERIFSVDDNNKKILAQFGQLQAENRVLADELESLHDENQQLIDQFNLLQVVPETTIQSEQVDDGQHPIDEFPVPDKAEFSKEKTQPIKIRKNQINPPEPNLTVVEQVSSQKVVTELQEKNDKLSALTNNTAQVRRIINELIINYHIESQQLLNSIQDLLDGKTQASQVTTDLMSEIEQIRGSLLEATAGRDQAEQLSATLRAENERLLNSLKDASSLKDQADQKINNLIAENSLLNTSLQNISSEKEKADKTTADLTSTNEQLQKAILNASISGEQAEQTISELQVDNDRLQMTISELSKSVELSNQSITRTQTENEQLRQELGSVSNAREQAEQTNVGLRVINEQLENSLKSVTVARENADQSVADLTTENERHVNSLQQLTVDRDKANQLLDILQKEKGELSAALQSSREAKEQLDLLTVDLQTENDQLLKTKQDLDLTKSQSEQTIASLKSDLEDKLLKKQEADNTIINLLKENQTLQVKLQEFTNLIEQSDKGTTQLIEENQQLHRDIQSLSDTKSQEEKLVDNLQAENQKLQTSLQNALDQTHGDSQTIENLRVELNQALNETKRLDDSLKSANNQLKTLHGQIQETTNIVAQKDATVQSLAQEIMQPVASINGYINLLLSENVGKLGSVPQRFVERIKISTEHLNSLVENLTKAASEVASAQPLEIKIQPMSLNKSIEQAIANTTMQRDFKKLGLNVYLPKNPPRLSIEQDALKQIVEILLQNANLNTPVKGVIALRAQVESSQPEQSNLLIQVTNSGKALSQDEIKDMFSMDNEEGINLSIAKTLIDSLGGRIWAESGSDQSTTVKVSIPFKPYQELNKEGE